MIYFIIPLIHPNHKGVDDYDVVESCLEKTLISINNIIGEVKVILVANKKPEFIDSYNNIIFIQIKAKIFDIIKDLDTESVSFHKINPKYFSILKMNGKYHNKDKGLKYFIGLNYLANLSQRPKYIGLIDGDDYLHKNLYKYLENQNPRFNLFNIHSGYLLTEDVDTNLYTLDNFSNICGTNRIFRYNKLKKALKHRLNYNIKNIPMNDNLVIDDQYIINLINIIKNKPYAWNIIPLFLGKHVIRYPNGYAHKLYNFFNIMNINKRIAIKYQHINNHSNRNNNQNHIIVKKFRDKGYIRHDIKNKDEILKNFIQN